MNNKIETIDEFLKRGGVIKKGSFNVSYEKIRWGKSKNDYINAYKIRKEKKNKLKK